ncbi:enolase C-terminal domain-like protein [Asanoa sp. NPDC050611]|uniref:mandelate racemase/muconate lactonizing enzyme family protein n=1 Tax=Asanoa sp. NPDC050611 TaxID=3157098 RepID=UPI0034010A0D
MMETERRAAPRPGLTIDAIRTSVVTRPYLRPFGISSGTSEVLTSLVVDVVAGDRVGRGEAAPMTAYTGETLDGVRGAVEQVLAPALVGRGLHGIADAVAVMDATVRHQHLAKAAVDIALHDLVAASAGVPAHTLLGGATRAQVPIAWVVGLGEVDEVVAEACEHAARGFRHIKVKGGEDPARDVRLVRALTAALPVGVETSLDANEGYSRADAIPALLDMDDAGLSMVEQPLPRWDLRGLAELRRRLRLRVMVDESVQSLHDALAVIRAEAADIINIKVLKVGGLHRARQVAALAEAAGLAVKVGSMPELGVATLAGLHLAATTPSGSPPADLVGPLMVEGDPVAPDVFGAGRHGFLPVPDGPGLGHQPAPDGGTR